VTNRNVAVFIDAENLFKGYGKLEIPDISMEQILEQLETAAAREAGAGSIALARAYADWGALGLEDYRRDVERAGVETVQVFSVSKAEKNAADIVLVVDCLRAAADLDQLEVFILVSADGDFVPLVRRLHELDKYVIGATLADHPVNNVLEREVDQYVPLKVKPVPPAAALQPIFSPPRRPCCPASPPASRRSSRAPTARSRSSPRRRPSRRRRPGVTSRPRSRRPRGTTWPRRSRSSTTRRRRRPTSTSRSSRRCWPMPRSAASATSWPARAARCRCSPWRSRRQRPASRALRFALADTPYALARESDDVQPVLVLRSTDPSGMLTDLSLDDIQRGVQ
jgi:uncharacterized LabA/DUF88 family protein